MHPSHHAKNNPNRTALIIGETGQTISYLELDRAANRNAHLLRRLGLQRGGVIAVMLDNEPSIFEIAWGAQRTGLYLTSISTKLGVEDITYILKDSGARILIASDRLEGQARSALSSVSGVQGFTVRGEGGVLDSWRELAAGCPNTPVADENPGADMLYSSGTTGRPKGVRPALPDGPLTSPTADRGALRRAI